MTDVDYRACGQSRQPADEDGMECSECGKRIDRREIYPAANSSAVARSARRIEVTVATSRQGPVASLT
jgi:hypothetical protein